jgi:hypothetical protein
MNFQFTSYSWAERLLFTFLGIRGGASFSQYNWGERTLFAYGVCLNAKQTQFIRVCICTKCAASEYIHYIHPHHEMHIFDFLIRSLAAPRERMKKALATSCLTHIDSANTPSVNINLRANFQFHLSVRSCLHSRIHTFPAYTQRWRVRINFN